MHYLQISGVPVIEESEATGELADLYERSKIVLQSPFVANMVKAFSASPNLIGGLLDAFQAFFQALTLPQSLVAMISYCVPETKNCAYCAANGELHCRTVGINEEMLHMIARDLGNVSPLRVRAILEFAIKCAVSPQDLTAEDYDHVRDFGVSDEELLEVVFIAAFANFTDTLADALKLEVDEGIVEALKQFHN